jgi:diadenosine tetraphosphatase ApaH/serine/threonine PP2A family protein phosphatase
VRYAILSDIHSNATALSAVLDQARREGVGAYLCPGDIVGYGPDPGETIAMLRELPFMAVRGNHDEAAVSPGAEERFNELARAAVAWTRDRLSEGERAFLAGLPLTESADGMLLVHAAPSAPSEWLYVFSVEEAVREFEAFGERICLTGHSHVPMFVRQTGRTAELVPPEGTTIEEGARYFLNVGSVGQPRDHDPRAAFAVLDTDDDSVRLLRVPYDAASVCERMISAGLPAALGERLLSGV